MISNVNSNSNIQNENPVVTSAQINSISKKYSYGLRARLKSISRYLSCGFNSAKRRNIAMQEFTNTNISNIDQLKNRSAEIKTILLSSDKLSNKQKLEFYAKNRKSIDIYCKKAGIKNPLLENSSFSDIEKITVQGIYTANFPIESNIETFMNAFVSYVDKEFSTIEGSDNLDEKFSKLTILHTNLKQITEIFNKMNLNSKRVDIKKLSKKPIKKQYEKTLECFFTQAIITQKVLRVAMPIQEWLNQVNRDNSNTEGIQKAWNECKKQKEFDDQKKIFESIKTLTKFKNTLNEIGLNAIHNFTAKFDKTQLNRPPAKV